MADLNFKGFRLIDGTKDNFNPTTLENGYMHFIRTDSNGENGYIYFYGKKYGNVLSLVVSTTYSELKTLRDSEGLSVGTWYRITDYDTIIYNNADVVAARHPFDILVLATDVNKLSEDAKAVHSERDTDEYFAEVNLDAWELKYCLDNDTDKFAWANSTDGKGVIYWLKDEWNNECPYDFKNIQFNVLIGFNYFQWGSDYSFVRNSTLDEEINGVIYYGYTCSVTPSAWSSPNCFVTDSPMTTTSTLYRSAGGPPINLGGNIVLVNSEEIYGIYTFSIDNNGVFEDATLSGSNDISKNVILSYIKESKLNLNRIWFIGINNKGNTFGSGCYNNTFGNLCYNNTFGNDCYNNTFGNICYNNTFGDACNGNTFGNGCNSNTFGNYFDYNTFGNICNSNTFGNMCYNNIFGNDCYNNTFGNDCSSNEILNHVGCITVFERVIFVSIGSINGGVRYAQILNGTTGTDFSSKLRIDFAVDKNYTQIAGKNSAGELKIWVPADMISST